MIKCIATIKDNGYQETNLNINSHTGTHIDAPAHMIENSRYLSHFPISRFTGKALVLNIPEGTEVIDKSWLILFEYNIKECDFVLFNTGWSKYWGTDKYFENFPVLSETAANWLISFPIKGIGIDAISIDPTESTDWPNHYLFFNEDIFIIENLIFPKEMDSEEGDFYCFPLNYEKADGSPVRAILHLR